MSAAEQAEIFKSIQEYEQIKHSLTPEQRAQYDQGFEAAKMRLSPEQQSLLNKTQSTTVIEKTEPITAKGAVYHTVDPHQVELEKLKIQLSREAVAADLEAKKIMAQAQVKSAAYGAGGNLLGKVADFFIVKELQNNQAPIYANSPITGSVYGNITPSSPISPVITTHPHAGLINNPAPLYQGDPITTGGSYGHHGIGNTGTVDGVIRTGSGQVYDYSKDVNPISTNSGNPTPPAATNTTVIG